MAVFTNTSARAGYDTSSILKRSLTGLNTEFSLSYTIPRLKSLVYPTILPRAGGRIVLAY